jgi:hypothetical protein
MVSLLTGFIGVENTGFPPYFDEEAAGTLLLVTEVKVFVL